jgi:ABC-type polysaccharide/polyol phosphate transport system ATPase subunit
VSEAIALSGVSKRFILHHDRPRSFQELMLRVMGRNHNHRTEEFWAVRDLDLAVERGETLGFIGSNGAGKSTVLKLIARILQPTSGSISVSGRLTALLELGAGFHPDLTGRENIFLNGSILGLTARDMRNKLDDIVAFAELERFIDMPLRHYSSGMKVRLGFAVATSLDPEILLIDEVLAVGDESFQKKCLARIDDFRRCQKTILFVSHDLETVKRLCHRAIWLEDGLLAGAGPAIEVVERYRQYVWEEEAQKLAAKSPTTASSPKFEQQSHWGSGEVIITGARLLDQADRPIQLLQAGEPLRLEIGYQVLQDVPSLVFGFAFYRRDGLRCYGTNTDLESIDLDGLPPVGKVYVDFPSMDLIADEYTLDVAIHNKHGHAYDYYHPFCSFLVRSHTRDVGVYRPTHVWGVEAAAAQDVRRQEQGP